MCTSFFLFDLLFQDFAPAIHVTYSYVIVQNFKVGFKPSQLAFFVMSDVYNRVIVVYQRFFFHFPFEYNISDLFVLVNCYQMFFLLSVCNHCPWFKSNY